MPARSPANRPRAGTAVKRVSPIAQESISISPLMPDENLWPFMEALRLANPEPVTELRYSDPFTLLIAVVLSAQTTDIGVNRVTPGLFALAPNAAAMAQLDPVQVQHEIRTIGLSNTKSRNVVALARQLIALHGGEVPSDRAALEALPGVGRKTANVVLNVVFRQSTMAVDTHIFRLGNRTGLAPGRTPRAVEDGLLSRIPENFLLHAHHWLILHGRYICTARKPLCFRCTAAAWCMYPHKTAA